MKAIQWRPQLQEDILELDEKVEDKMELSFDKMPNFTIFWGSEKDLFLQGKILLTPI